MPGDATGTHVQTPLASGQLRGTQVLHQKPRASTYVPGVEMRYVFWLIRYFISDCTGM